MSGETPAKDDSKKEGGQGTRKRWLSVLLLTAVLWCVAAFLLHSWLPKRNWQNTVDAIDQGPGLAQAVRVLCESSEGRELLGEKRRTLEGQRARLLEWTLHTSCTELVDPEEPALAWMFDSQPGPERTALLLTRFEESDDAVSKQRLASRLLRTPQQLSDAQLGALVRWQLQQPGPLESILGAEGLREKGVLALLIAELSAVEGAPPKALTRALSQVWGELPREVQLRLAQDWVQVRWIVRDSGAVGEPQPLRLEAEYAPPSVAEVAQLRLAVFVTDIQINEEEAEHAGNPLSEAFQVLVLDEPGVKWAEVDLTRFFLEHGKNTLSLHYEWLIVPKDVELKDLATLEPQALIAQKGGIDSMGYRVFLGVDRGLPKTLHEKELDKWVMSAMNVSITVGENEVALRSAGEGVEARPKEAVQLDAQVAPFLTLSSAKWPTTTFALRFQAQQLPRGEWVDVGDGIVLGGEDTTARYTSRRFDLDFAPALSDATDATLALRARASLRVARTHPKVNSYWGENIDLGQLRIQNLTPRQGSHWRAAQHAVEKLK